MACSRLSFTFTEPACTISSTTERQRKREKDMKKKERITVHVLNGN
jgi:hypothetical protein